MSLVRNLYRIARIANTTSVLLSGNPKRINRRAKNILVGKMLARSHVWRNLWK